MYINIDWVPVIFFPFASFILWFMAFTLGSEGFPKWAVWSVAMFMNLWLLITTVPFMRSVLLKG